ncbi:integrin beta-1-binding protein 1 [Pyxicephalus adspersus]|uniref:integrin beta-1-binding protein 1 n=1 Tax=Pyxicephalus adspersus TaxID=30357 RepID=UPI003B5B2824
MVPLCIFIEGSAAGALRWVTVGLGTSGWNCDKRMFRKGKKRHSSSSSQSSEISTKSKSVDSSLGGLSRSSTVASLDTDSTKSFGQATGNSDPCAEFRVKYVGSIERVQPEENKPIQGPLDLINYIDVAQQDGKPHHVREQL